MKKTIYLMCFLCLIVFTDIILLHSLYSKSFYEQKKIESILPEKEEKEKIRVLIKTDGFEQLTHSQVKFQVSGGMYLQWEGGVREYSPDEEICILPDDERFINGTIQIKCKNTNDKISITSLKRGCGVPSYRGTMELFWTAEGIVIVNEVGLEQYLYAVVPSEMPASYETEALKAQSVCARSYAYNQSNSYAYPEYEAHVDDSTTFQVYGNSKEQERAIKAVKETEGEVLWYDGKVATAYYYSTSCGKTTSIKAWGKETNTSNQYLKSIEICNENGAYYEESLPWYRWKAMIPKEILSNLLELNTQTEIGNLESLSITKYGDGGIVQEIVAIGEKGKIIVETENKIRKALGGRGYVIEKQDGTVISSTSLLPSAFFSIVEEEDNYILNGGGYGHGIGMSQNGANEMAKDGKNYQEILRLFYSNVEIK